MIELTNEQIDAFKSLNGGLRELVDPHTHETFVLVPADEYKRMQEEDDEVDYGPWTPEEMAAVAASVADEVGWIEWEEDENESSPSSSKP